MLRAGASATGRSITPTLLPHSHRRFVPDRDARTLRPGRLRRTFFPSHSTVTEFVLDDYMRRAETLDDGVPHDAVTAREREIIQLLAEGKSNKEVASTLGISVKTIEAHRANIMRTLHLRSVSELVRYAIRNKIVQP
jgi:DNA-binding NarL/FixJ family response regulator